MAAHTQRPRAHRAALATLGLGLLAAAALQACEDEQGWRCCQSTALTCVCSASLGMCRSDAVVESCDLDSVPGDSSFCCAHDAIGTCSCSGDDGEPAEEQCAREGDYPVADCSVEPAGPPSEGCSAAESGANLASCDSDSDCYSAFCDTSARPLPICDTPTREARVNGHGYDCETDQDCEQAAPTFVERGGLARCRSDNTHFGCAFSCEDAEGR